MQEICTSETSDRQRLLDRFRNDGLKDGSRLLRRRLCHGSARGGGRGHDAPAGGAAHAWCVWAQRALMRCGDGVCRDVLCASPACWPASAGAVARVSAARGSKCGCVCNRHAPHRLLLLPLRSQPRSSPLSPPLSYVLVRLTRARGWFCSASPRSCRWPRSPPPSGSPPPPGSHPRPPGAPAHARCPR
jgi:hypothetical protein